MIRILFLAANPIDQAHLRIRQEFDEIRRALDTAEYGKQFLLIQEVAVMAGQLQELLFRHKPQIVHFSGHGEESGLILFEGADGESHSVSPQILHDLFAHFTQTVRCVVLNACYSQTQANAIATVIDSVVGMNDAVTDQAALNFAPAFFRALANGKTLASAVGLGCNQLDLQNLGEADKPQLFAERIDANQMQALEWDKQSYPEAPTIANSIIPNNTSGGAAISHDVNIDGGDFVNRDKHEHHHYHYGSPPPQPTTTTKPRGIFGLYPFNQNFFGRGDELATLHTLLQKQTNVTICPVITGMGGLGKTQLAAHYARAHVDDYPDGIYWITAANLNDIRSQLADFCVALSLPVADPQRSVDLTEQKIVSFKDYLGIHPRALLIFDNVEEPDFLHTSQIGVQLTTLTLGGKQLVTTRRSNLSSDKFVELKLQGLLLEPARQILLAARIDLSNDPDLDQLCDQFGYLPLMLNLAAAALKKRGGPIANYIQRLQTLGAEKLHSEVAKVSLDDYHKSLTIVLHEQWAVLRDDNARLLLRVAGQLPEAALIPTARLGLLAGLVDVDEWERPLSDSLDELVGASLIERVDTTTIRLHPLVREFAEGLTDTASHDPFCVNCVKQLHRAYCGENGLLRLGEEYQQRGIAALIIDLVTATNLLQSARSTSEPQLSNQLQSLLQLLRHEAYKLTKLSTNRKKIHLWQQILFYATTIDDKNLIFIVTQLLRKTVYWLPQWIQRNEPLTLEQTLFEHKGSVNKIVLLDSQRIISASSDKTLKIWNLTNGKVERTLRDHELWVLDVAVLDHKHVVSASADKTIKI